jgi:site-specific DNA recombinase
MVKQVMKNFIDAYKETLNREQRKYLLHLLINKITLAENREIDSIEILNNDVVKHFSINGERDHL